MEQESINQETEYIRRFLLITKDQLKIMDNVLEVQSIFEEKLVKEKIEEEINKLNRKSKYLTTIDLINEINQNDIINYCSYIISADDFHSEKINKDRAGKKENFFYNNNANILNQWLQEKINGSSKKFIKKKYSFYNYKNKQKNLLLSIQCSQIDLNPNYRNLKESIKKNIHTNLLINTNIKDTKIALFWINSNIDTNSNEILYEGNIDKRKKKYNLGELSNVENIPTGKLTIKEIFKARDKNPLKHKIGNKHVLTWITDLSQNNNYFLLAYSINEKELRDKNRAKILFLLPEILALGISFILMFFLFRNILKDINTLTKTAIKVNQGVKNIRSNVKGENDIGVLGSSFDSMLDFFENNIKSLDKKVKEKTKEISKSLEEKEILLKEIHHRVKNNLALTIGLIELQENEIADEKTKKVLTNIQERIYAMELVHRKLYESQNLNKIFLKDYIVDLIDIISKAYNKQDVNINLCIDNIYLNIEEAIPFGLVTNELIVNAFKYGFNNQRFPQLDVIAKKEDDESISLTIKDNGKGLDKNFYTISNKTLGLKLINKIVKYQLLGTFDYKYNNGANFIIKSGIKAQGNKANYFPNN